MNVHPAKLMMRVWFLTWAAFFILPIQVIGRPMSIFGGVLFALFFLSFCIGASLVKMPQARPFPVPPQPLDWTGFDRLLKIVCLISLAALLVEAGSANVFDLSEAAIQRNLAAEALSTGAQSNSSAAFQVAFLTYPASYAYLVRKVIFDQKPDVIALVVFGIIPTVLSSLVMGGRGPIFYSLIIGLLSLAARRKYLGPKPVVLTLKQRRQRRFIVVGTIGAFIAAIFYAANVFLVRAEAAGGASAMFDAVEIVWGVSFRGPGFGLLTSLVGETNTFLVMVAGWYAVQSIVMSNYLLGSYEGPMQWGVYGMDLASALMRRIDGDTVNSYFNSLQQLGTYGFLPSAFGTLWVDYAYLGMPIAMVWGYVAAIIFKKCREGQDARWLLLAPFITAGIVFSINNTPLGMTNGLMVYGWLFLAFRKIRHGSPAAPPEPLLAPVAATPLRA